MENKDIVIIALIVVTIYLYYQQSNLNIQSTENKETENNQISDLQNQVQHYQSLYQKRVEKDLGYSQLSQKTQTEDLAILTNQDKEILQKPKNVVMNK